MKKEISRPTWEEYFLRVASVVGTRSTCMRRQVGAVLTINNKIVATGYNGVPSKVSNCWDTECLREKLNVPSGKNDELCRGLHAEQNVILQAKDLSDGILYVTHKPCILCSKIIANSGIIEVHFMYDYPHNLSDSILKDSGVKLFKHEEFVKEV